MSHLPITLEFYPKYPFSFQNQVKQAILSNSAKWDSPFFMDVYKYADLNELTRICAPFLQDPKLKNLIILGTGGSYQTMKALSLLSQKTVYFLTSSRPYELSHVLVNTTPEDSLVIPISRAGKTLDVNSILGSFKSYKILALSSQGPMFDMVKKISAKVVDVPDLSGRFAASVCSVVLIPALLAEIDVSAFQKGLEEAYSAFKNLEDPHNLALQFATYLFGLYQKGYRNIFSMPYSKWLEGSVGLFVQEISESSGKSNKGLLGTWQAAPLCQHSVLELILGGSKGHTSPLLWSMLQEPVDVPIEPIEPILEGQSGLSIINYQLDATFQALLEQEVPASKITLESISAYTLGTLIAFIQSTVYYYCIITDVNWSSNPLVNTGKKICNDALIKKSNFTDRINARQEIVNKRFKNFYSEK
jgi:glucose-6-phosphate isomerase